MFICIGENENTGYAVGEGDTILEAVNAWAYNVEKFDQVQEFNRYHPAVYEAKKLDVRVSADVRISLEIGE